MQVQLLVVNKAKGRISKRVFQESKARQNFQKTSISYPLICTRLRFALLPYYRRTVFKKRDRNSKDNFRPVSILPSMCKVFERCIFRQFYSFMLEFLSKYQGGFRKGSSTQYCLLAILEKWKSAVDKGKSFGALLADLPKVFDCIYHKLLLAKLHAY